MSTVKILNIATVGEDKVVAIVDGTTNNPIISDRIYKLGTADPISGRINAWRRFTGEKIMIYHSLNCVDITEEAKREGWRF